MAMEVLGSSVTLKLGGGTGDPKNEQISAPMGFYCTKAIVFINNNFRLTFVQSGF